MLTEQSSPPPRRGDGRATESLQSLALDDGSYTTFWISPGTRTFGNQKSGRRACFPAGDDVPVFRIA
jgi:hypothetical protein